MWGKLIELILRNYDTSFSVLSRGVEGEKPYFRSKREAMEHEESDKIDLEGGGLCKEGN